MTTFASRSSGCRNGAPCLYPHDYLAGYAGNYVSWGVIAIYRFASGLMNPVQFTKVVTGFLFILSALLIYRLALVFRDDLTALWLLPSISFSDRSWETCQEVCPGFSPFLSYLGYLPDF